MSNLQRFLLKQNQTHPIAIQELKKGYKVSHWSWWEIPQVAGLGRSIASEKYAIKDIEEAREYLKNETLRHNLLEICNVLLSLDSEDAESIMGYPDNLKLRSCMTLFLAAEPQTRIFQDVLDKFFNGKQDERTMRLLGI